MRPTLLFCLLAGTCALATCTGPAPAANLSAPLEIRIDAERAPADAERLRREVNARVADGLDLSLYAGDSLVQDPIAISFAPDGRLFYTQATRQRSSEFDIRGHMDWTEESLSWTTPEDRRAFLRRHFAPVPAGDPASATTPSGAHLKDLDGNDTLDWRDLTVEAETIWYLTDENGDGTADRSRRYLADFHEEITDVANGLAFHDGEVYLGVAPDLWRIGDDDGDGTADRATSISHGYGVHVGFSGHGMSGVTVGPLGRLWWGIGDIGSNVVDRDGHRHANPNRGVVVRCDPDGSNFEVFAHGVRNTHEFAFDDYGNLITIDNDGDHPGERERLVYLIDGSDTGWRINWQFGKYTDPKNNTYKVWMDEGMYLPRHAEQAAYFLPPIQQYVNGPTSLVRNPGTALAPRWYDHFFVAEFRGSPGNSPIHAFTMEPAGAGFQLGETEIVAEGLLPTGLDFGPDGALYFGDWINGWGVKDEGRVWRLDAGAAAGADTVIRSQVSGLLTQDFTQRTPTELFDLLAHQDRRIRQKAQFALAKDDANFYDLLDFARTDTNPRLARIHALWAMAQLARAGYDFDKKSFLAFLGDADDELIAQGLRVIGDLRIKENGEAAIPLLDHANPRVAYFALEALGRTATKAAFAPVVERARANAGADIYLRHGALIALSRLATADQLAGLAKDPDREVRLIALVALRRQESPRITAFLDDPDEYVVAEAARAITDDNTIPGAMAALAGRLTARPWTNEPLLRRLIVANGNVGDAAAVDRLSAYATDPDNTPTLRAEALAVLGNWASPSVFDRVNGRYKGERPRDATPVVARLNERAPGLIAAGHPAVRMAAIRAAASLQLQDTHDQLARLLTADRDPAVRAASLAALDRLRSPRLATLLRAALDDRDDKVRQRALELLPRSTVAAAEAVRLYRDVMTSGTVGEGQAALAGLAVIDDPAARSYLAELLQNASADRLPPALHLDLFAAIEQQDDPNLTAQLTAYETALRADDELGLLAAALTGGDIDRGNGLFYWNSTAQCTRCHAIFEYGGNVGPNLAGVGDRLNRREILESIIRPSAALAPGHETVLLTLRNDDLVSGLVLDRTPDYVELRTGKTDTRRIAYADVVGEETLPSSMPSAEGKLSRREIRDLVAFLATVRD